MPTRTQQADAVSRLVRESVKRIDAIAPDQLRALMPVLVKAREELQRDLSAWLANAPDGADRFTAYQKAQALRSLEATFERLEDTEPAMSRALGIGRKETGPLAVENLHTEVQRLSAIYGGGVPTLPQIDTAAIIAQGNKLLWRRHENSAKRYAGGLGDDLKLQFGVALAKGETFEQMTQRLRKLGGFRAAVGASTGHGENAAAISDAMFHRWRFWADRLVRTENMHAYNVQHDLSIEHVNANRGEDEEEYLRRWDASADRVTCERCKELDRTLATIDGTFRYGYKSPPAHPYCRCVVLAWLARWGNFKGEAPSKDHEGKDIAPVPFKPKPKPSLPQDGKPLTVTEHEGGRRFADFGLLDERGRSIGGIGRVFQQTGDPAWHASVHAARDGERFGAIPRGGSASFGSKAEAEAWLRGKFEAQHARYAKTATPRPEGMRAPELKAQHGSRVASTLAPAVPITEGGWEVPIGRTMPRKYLRAGADNLFITDNGGKFRVEGKAASAARSFDTIEAAQEYARQQLAHKSQQTAARAVKKAATAPAPVAPSPPPADAPPPKERKNAKRVAAAKIAAEASAERRREIHSAARDNLAVELRTTWDKEGHKFMQEEAHRIKGVKDNVNASSTISQAFAEKYGSGEETMQGNEGDRYFKRAEIEAQHAESWADEQEAKYYKAAQAAAMRDGDIDEHGELTGRGRSRSAAPIPSAPKVDDDDPPF